MSRTAPPTQTTLPAGRRATDERADDDVPRIAVLGCTGYTGRLVTALLDEWGERAMLVGRDPERLAALTRGARVMHRTRVADACDQEQVVAALRGARAVISCIGPYNLYGSAVRDAAIRMGLVYVDVTGEQPFVADSFCRAEAAEAAGATLVVSCAFESCLADFLASRVTRPGGRYEEISSYYLFDGARPSPGTRLSMKLARFFEQRTFEEGALRVRNPLEVRRPVSFSHAPAGSWAAFVPYPEVLFFSRAHSTRNAFSFALVGEDELDFADRLAKDSEQTLEDVLRRARRTDARAPSPEQRERQAFHLMVEAREKGGRVHRAHLRGRDMYKLTGLLAASAALTVLEAEERPLGVLSPAEALPPGYFDEIVARHRLELSIEGS